MLDMEICKSRYHIHNLPSILYMIVCIVVFPFSITIFNATFQEILSLSFALREGVISFFEISTEILSPMNKNTDDN